MAIIQQLGATQVVTTTNGNSTQSNALVIGAAETVRVSSSENCHITFTATDSGTAAATNLLLTTNTLHFFSVPNGFFLNVIRIGSSNTAVSVTSVDLR
tara:strand:+ start:512 stop:805 length:294 start_codon:yes stop_codon:yes gene_type:complete